MEEVSTFLDCSQAVKWRAAQSAVERRWTALLYLLRVRWTAGCEQFSTNKHFLCYELFFSSWVCSDWGWHFLASRQPAPQFCRQGGKKLIGSAVSHSRQRSNNQTDTLSLITTQIVIKSKSSVGYENPILFPSLFVVGFECFHKRSHFQSTSHDTSSSLRYDFH